MYWMVQPSAFHPEPSQKSVCWPSNLAHASSYTLSSAGDISGSDGVTATLFRSAGTFLALASCSDPKRRPEVGRRDWWRLGGNEEMGRAAGAAERDDAKVEGAEDSKRAIPAAVAMAAIALLLVESTTMEKTTACWRDKRAKPSTQQQICTGLDFIHP